MKTLFAICLLSCAVFAQANKLAPQKDQSNLEQFTQRSGTLIEKSFEPAGNVSGIKVEIFKVRDLIGSTVATGIKFSKNISTTYSTDEKAAVLDADEVDGLIKSLQVLKTQFATSRDSYTEIIYRSRSGFEAGAYFSDGKWTPFIQIDKYDSRSLTAVPAEGLEKLQTQLVAAKGSLK